MQQCADDGPCDREEHQEHVAAPAFLTDRIMRNKFVPDQ